MPTIHAAFEESEVRIPSWVTDNASFLRWAESDDAPQRGKIGYFQGTVWIDTTVEQFFHVHIKQAVCIAVQTWALQQNLGMYTTDGVLVTCPEVELSAQPDGHFVSHDTMKKGIAVLKAGLRGTTLVGPPDMVLEVVSRSSVKKDLKTLKELYHQAGIKEYWVVDSRVADPELKIFRSTSKGYVSVSAHQGWSHSEVLGAQFKLVIDESQKRVVLERK
jgi:Uma2 family endonuclease